MNSPLCFSLFESTLPLSSILRVIRENFIVESALSHSTGFSFRISLAVTFGRSAKLFTRRKCKLLIYLKPQTRDTEKAKKFSPTRDRVWALYIFLMNSYSIPRLKRSRMDFVGTQHPPISIFRRGNNVYTGMKAAGISERPWKTPSWV